MTLYAGRRIVVDGDPTKIGNTAQERFEGNCMEEFEEPAGYYNLPGFVKSNPKNNESYLAKCKEVLAEWADVLQEAHDKILEVDPNYNIIQIKNKFGGLRFYIDSEVPQAYDIVAEAERKATLLR